MTIFALGITANFSRDICGTIEETTQLVNTGLPQIQDFEIPDFFKTFSGQETIFFKTANDRNFTRAYQKL